MENMLLIFDGYGRHIQSKVLEKFRSNHFLFLAFRHISLMSCSPSTCRYSAFSKVTWIRICTPPLDRHIYWMLVVLSVSYVSCMKEVTPEQILQVGLVRVVNGIEMYARLVSSL